MGGCATKLRVLKAEGDAPEPQEQPLTLSDPTNKIEEEKEEDNKRISLGHLFKENEENKVASENEEITIKERNTASQLETKEGEEEQTKTEVLHFTADSEIKTEEPKLSPPLNEEEKTMEVADSTVKEVTVDSSSVDGELKPAIF